MKRIELANYKATHFGYSVSGKVATVTLNRPDRKNPLTFDSYGELRDLFREMVHATDVKAIVFTGEGGNFCSGGDVHSPTISHRTAKKGLSLGKGGVRRKPKEKEGRNAYL